MIIFTMTEKAKNSVAAAVAAHGSEFLARAGLGRLGREEAPMALSGLISVWPADADGMYRVALSDAAGRFAWRCFILAEIAAGDGWHYQYLIHRYRQALGIQTIWAHDYVCAVVKGTRLRPVAHGAWSDGVAWVIKPRGGWKARLRWGPSQRRNRARAHQVLSECGLARPLRQERDIWHPRATCLVIEPKPIDPPETMLSLEDDAAIEALVD